MDINRIIDWASELEDIWRNTPIEGEEEGQFFEALETGTIDYGDLLLVGEPTEEENLALNEEMRRRFRPDYEDYVRRCVQYVRDRLANME